MKKAVLYFFVWLTGASFFHAEAQGIKKFFCDFRKDTALSGAVSAFHIIELSNGKTVTGYQSDRLMIPASTLKTLYVFSALDDYGSSFRFRTDLFYTGNLQNDTLHGDLIIRSEGDPTWASPYFRENLDSIMNDMLNGVRSRDIHYVTGRILVSVNGFYYPAPGSWPIEDIGNYYGSGYWGFNYHDNMYKIFLKTGSAVGSKVTIHHIEPEVPGLELISLLKSGPPGSGDQAYIYGVPFTYERYILGSVPAGSSLFEIKGSIPNPPLTFGRYFTAFLNKNGIGVGKAPGLVQRLVPVDRAHLLWYHISPSLAEIGKKTLNYSINHYSEALARLTVERGRPAEGYINRDSINAYFRSKGFRRIDLEDGCGLAPDNLIAPEEYTAFFHRIYRKHGLDYLLDILPKAGKDGYARFFLRNSPEQEQVWVKSGSVSKVRNYVGVFRGKSGKYYAFAIMVNHFRSSHKAVKKAIERVLEESIRHL